MQAKIGLARGPGCGPQTYFYGDEAMTKEEIMTTIQGLANKLGRVPTLTELKTMTPVTLLQSEFPDCEALRQVMRDKWQRLRIEF
jgi:hypothetical protein